jgi:hypothetical protein
MAAEGPTLQDIWRLLGTMNKRFDAIERQVVQVRDEVAGLKAHVTASVGALKESIGGHPSADSAPGPVATRL